MKLRYICLVTFAEPERLALALRELIERRAALQAALRSALQEALTDAERADIQRVLDHMAQEKASLEQRLEALLKQPGTGGTG
ncbi:hypothetical protein [Ramlibacter henchirensis]|uniref:hypothetical protein n=1 Tax=Ramlibacter henchirensis TaxID=204072 RepID=UPI00107628FC|nr:hypothetical protein [Ramlibacter henchirensis]